MIRLERAFRLDADYVGLILAQPAEPDADLGEVQPGATSGPAISAAHRPSRAIAVLVVGEQLDLRIWWVNEARRYVAFRQHFLEKLMTGDLRHCALMSRSEQSAASHGWLCIWLRL